MAKFVYSYLEMCGVLGTGEPDCPGSDFGLDCVIEAETADQALQWGYRVLGDFVRARTQHVARPHDGSPIDEGAIDSGCDIDEILRDRPKCAQCRVGELPIWIEPWKHDESSGVRLTVSH